MITKINFNDHTFTSYSIRKFTPRECFRLMGVRENIIDRMMSTYEQAKDIVPALGKPDEQVVSNAQLYKQAGNSIVVDVLAAIYEQLWYPKEHKSPYAASLFDMMDVGPTLPSKPNHGDTGEEKVFITTFSGYDSQLMAADVLNQRHPDFKWTCEGWSDIDKYVITTHNMIYPQYAGKFLGDITLVDWNAVKQRLGGKEVDMFTYSSPCQDISQAGKQMGLKEGSNTRSSLLWHVADAVEVLRPKFLLQENVAALVSQKFLPDFELWLKKLESLGYVSRWARLNAKDYGVPQNRDRVFCLSMRKDVAFDFHFPEPEELRVKLVDVLEDEVEEKYHLRAKDIEKFLLVNDTDNSLFLNFDVPTCHASAMVIKSLLMQFFDVHKLWEHDRNDTEFFAKLNDTIKERFLTFINDPHALGINFGRLVASNYKGIDTLDKAGLFAKDSTVALSVDEVVDTIKKIINEIKSHK